MLLLHRCLMRLHAVPASTAHNQARRSTENSAASKALALLHDLTLTMSMACTCRTKRTVTATSREESNKHQQARQ
jgi:hypothetical protein